MGHPSDDAIGAKAVQLGYISNEQLQECLETSSLIREAGGNLPLEKIMLRKGYVTEFQASQILKHIGEPAAPIPLPHVEESVNAKSSDAGVTTIFSQPVVNKPLEEEVLIDSITRLDIASGEARHDLLPKSIGRCRIIRKIGGGGIGYVYLAEHDVLRKKVALKVLADHLMQNKEYIERLKKEAALTSRLNHPNIVQVHDAGIDAGKFYMVMQLVEGENLQERIDRQKRIPFREAMTIMIEICKGLGYAHAQGVIHRDIKPANILLSKEREIKITDFHLAIDAENTATSATRAILLGTPYFVSPELAQGEKADRRADIYSLGVMLYYMTTGRHPFTGKSSIDVLMKHIKEQAIHPRAVNNEIPENLCKVIAKMMAKLPNRRYQKVESVIADLQTLITQDESNSPIRIPPTPVIVTPLKPITKVDIPMLTPAPVQLPVVEPVEVATPPAPQPPFAEQEPRSPKIADRDQKRGEIYRRYAERKTGIGTIVKVAMFLLLIGGAVAAYVIFAPQSRTVPVLPPDKGKTPSANPKADTLPPTADQPQRSPEPKPPETTPADADWIRLKDLQKTINDPSVLRDAYLEFFNKYPDSRHAKEARELAAKYRTEAGEKTPPTPDKPSDVPPMPPEPKPPEPQTVKADPDAAIKLLQGTWEARTDLSSWTTSRAADVEIKGTTVKLTNVGEKQPTIFTGKWGGSYRGIRLKFTITEVSDTKHFVLAFAWNYDETGCSFFGLHGDHAEIVDMPFNVEKVTHAPKVVRPGIVVRTNESAVMTLVWEDKAVHGFLNNELLFTHAPTDGKSLDEYFFAPGKGIALLLYRGTCLIEEVALKKP